MSSQVEVGPRRGVVLVAVAGAECHPNHATGVAAGQPAFHVVLGAVQLPASALLGQVLRHFAHPRQGQEVRVCPSAGGLLEVDMHG